MDCDGGTEKRKLREQTELFVKGCRYIEEVNSFLMLKPDSTASGYGQLDS